MPKKSLLFQYKNKPKYTEIECREKDKEILLSIAHQMTKEGYYTKGELPPPALMFHFAVKALRKELGAFKSALKLYQAVSSETLN